MELEKEIRRYSNLNGYPIDSFESLKCGRGSQAFRLFSDDEEGGAFALCAECGCELDIESSKTYIEEAFQNICNCDNDQLHLGVGKSFYPSGQDVRWFMLALVAASATWLVCMWTGRNNETLFNQSLKYIPAYGLHRTPLSGRRLAQRYAPVTSIGV